MFRPRALPSVALVVLLAAGAACGDADECTPGDRRCIDNEAEICTGVGVWETVLSCAPDTSCSVAINMCIVLEGQSPCCMTDRF